MGKVGIKVLWVVFVVFFVLFVFGGFLDFGFMNIN